VAGYDATVPVVVVTGGSAGVGRAIAHAFGARGDRVAILARDQAGLVAATTDAESAGARAALGIPVDVADPSAVDGAASRVERELGPIDIWVNSAMTSVFAPFWEIEPAEFRRVTEVTYLGYVHGTRAALARMRPRNTGQIIQIGSALGYRGIPLQSAYCGAKHAINGFTESVRTELMHEHSRIRISIVQLPAVNTPQFDWVLSRLPNRAQPVPPIFQPEIIAKTVVHATTHYRREHWIGWSCTRAILAEHVMPAVLDRVLARTGYTSQQTDEPAPSDRTNNLWHPVAGHHTAHGRFDQRARKHSIAATLSRARHQLADRTGTHDILDRAANKLAGFIANNT